MQKPPQLHFPQRLYGRDVEISTCLSAFDVAGGGHGVLLEIPGRSGSGKTALVETLRHDVERRNGFFLSGKFNQFQQDIPLFALCQALSELGRQLLAMGSLDRERVVADIRVAVGDLGRLITELAPELELVMGPQPPVPEISPFEAPHRFAHVVRSFLVAVCRAERPLVLFLDDWQWADSASLAVIRQLQLGSTLRYILIILAWRDNEVGGEHAFPACLEELRRQTSHVYRVEVRDLPLPDVTQLLQDTLPPAVTDLPGLARHVHGSTGGNPFFVRTFLEYMSEGEGLWWNATAGVWEWNSSQLVEGDVVQLFAQLLSVLPDATKDLLSLAACLGNLFDLQLLASASGLSPSRCLEVLQGALALRAIVPVEASSPGAPLSLGRYRFRHDRVQQAAHALIAPSAVAGLRLRIGRMLLSHLSEEELESRLLEVTDHLNTGRQLIDEDAERIRLVELNVAAARRSMLATSYRAALHFNRVAAAFLDDPAFKSTLWTRHYGLALRLLKGWSETEFLEGDRQQAERCIHEAVAHARTPLDQADILCQLILQQTLTARYSEAITAGRRALAAVDIQLPETDFEQERDGQIAAVRRRLGERNATDFLSLPAMSDPMKLMAVRILITMGPPCYRSHQRLWAVIVPMVVNMTLEHGHVPQVGYSHTAFGGLLGWVDRDYSTAREFGRLADGVMANIFTAPSDLSVYHLMHGSSLSHWYNPMRQASDEYQKACESGLRSGNLQYAAYAYGHNMYCRFFQGWPLARLIHESEDSLHFSRTRTNQWAIDLLEGGLMLFRVLEGSLDVDMAEGAFLQDHVRVLESHGNIQVLCIHHILRAQMLLHLGHHRQALEAVDAAEPLIFTVGTQGLLPWPEHVVTRQLVHALLMEEQDPETQVAWRRELVSALELFQVWATHASANFTHKLLLLQGELLRLDGDPGQALKCCLKAADEASQEQFHHWQAFACERASVLAQQLGQGRLSHMLWQMAHTATGRWGARVKQHSMEDRLFSLLGESESVLPLDEDSRRFLERQLQLLRIGEGAEPSELLPEEHGRLLGELTLATANLREEVAERRRMESELQQHREQLTREIQERGAALDASRQLATELERQTVDLRAHREHLAEAHASTLNVMEDMVAARDRAELANQALRESEERHRALLEGLPDIVMRHDRKGRILFVTDNARLAFDIPSERFTMRTMRELGFPEAQCRFWEDAIEAVFNSGQSQEGVYSFNGAQGRVTHNVRLEPELDEDGTAVSVLSISRDITERQQAESVLQRRMELLATIASVSTRFLSLVDDGYDMAIQDTISAIGRLVGADRSYIFILDAENDTVSNTHEWCAHGVDPQMANLQALPTSLMPWWMELLRRGEVIHIPRVAYMPPEAGAEQEILQAQDIQSVLVLPILRQEHLEGFVGFDAVREAREWTTEEVHVLQAVANLLSSTFERKQAERALREGEERLWLALDAAEQGTWQHDLDLDQFQMDERAAAHFQQSERLVGWPHPLDSVHVDDHALVEQTMRTMQDDPDFKAVLEMRVVQADGSYRWLLVNAQTYRPPSGSNRKLHVFIGTTQDITARHESEQALRASEARYRDLVETTYDWIWELDAMGCYTYASPKSRELFGWDPDEVLGHSPTDFMDPEVAVMAVETFGGIWRRREPFAGLINVVRRRDGRRLVLETSGAPILDAEGQLVGYRGVDRDITARAEAEQRMATQARISQVLAEAATLEEATRRVVQVLCEAEGWDIGALWTVERQEGVLRCSELWCRDHLADSGIVGETRYNSFEPGEGLPGRVWASRSSLVVMNVAGDQNYLRREAATHSGLTCAFGVPVEHAGEVMGVLDFICRPMAEPDAPLLESLEAIGRQIGQFIVRRRLQEELQRVVSLGPAVIYTLRMTAGRWFPSWISENILQLSGFSVDEIGPAWWSERVHPEDRQRLQEAEASLLNEQASTVSFRLRRKDGEYIWLRDERRVLRDSQDKPLEVVGSWSNVTDLMRLEMQLRQSQKMEAIGQLAGGVAHDFNNLLTVINGYSEMLINSMGADDPHRMLLGDIRDAGERAAALTRQLLAFSRKQVLEPRTLDMAEVIRGLEKMLRRLIGEDIALATSLPPNLPKVRVDPSQLESVVVNLVVNARDAMNGGGHVDIELRPAEVDENFCRSHPNSRPGRFLRMTVSDTGSGMSEEVQARIFEPFFTTKEQGKGTGLGLSTVLGIVQQSDGFIDVFSRMGSGTAFHVYLPIAASQANANQDGKDDGPSGAGQENVLLVEDEPPVREVTRRILSSLGYQVVAAASAAEALELVNRQEGRFDLLLSDVIMPGMGGPELASVLTARIPDLRVLFMSGYTDDSLDRYGLDPAKTPLLQKPFSAAELARRVRQRLDQET